MARTRLYPASVDPAFPELAPTPDGWTRATFGDVFEVVERPMKLNPDAIYRLLTAKRSRGGIALRGELPGREILTKTQFETKAGDFLISRRQIIHGACGVIPAELDGAVVSNEYSTLRTRPTLSMDFLRHYTHAPYFQRTCFHSSHGVDVEKMINTTFWGPGFPFVTPGDITDTRVVRVSERFVTPAGLQRARAVPARSVLVTCIGSTIGKVGMAVEECCTNQQINSVVCSEGWSPEYVFFALVAAKGRILELASSTAVPIINKGLFERILVPRPPTAEQVEIATGLVAIEWCRDTHVAEIVGLRQVKAALMSVLLTGEVRVKPDQEAA